MEAVRRAERRGFSEAASNPGVGESALYQWGKILSEMGVETFRSSVNRAADEGENRQLRLENRTRREGADILKKNTGVLCEARAVNYAFIRSNSAGNQSEVFCRVLGVSRPGQSLVYPS